MRGGEGILVIVVRHCTKVLSMQRWWKHKPYFLRHLQFDRRVDLVLCGVWGTGKGLSVMVSSPFRQNKWSATRSQKVLWEDSS